MNAPDKPRRSKYLRALIGIATMLLGSSCGPANGRAKTNLRIFAASSLTDVFTELEAEFESTHPDIELEFNFAGSQVLRLQIEQGAPAQLFASADRAHVLALVEHERVEHFAAFADNTLTVIVPARDADPRHDRTASITRFDQLDQAERVVIGSPQLPVGAYTQVLLDRAAAVQGQDFVERIRDHIVSKENNVRLVRAKVELGEADAAIVYQSDARGRNKLRQLPIPAAINPRATYYIAIVAPLDSTAHLEAQAQAATRFVEYLLGPDAQALLIKHGFEATISDTTAGGSR